MSEQMYKAAGAEGAEAGNAADDDVVDADYEVIDDDEE